MGQGGWPRFRPETACGRERALLARLVRGFAHTIRFAGQDDIGVQFRVVASFHLLRRSVTVQPEERTLFARAGTCGDSLHEIGVRGPLKARPTIPHPSRVIAGIGGDSARAPLGRLECGQLKGDLHVPIPDLDDGWLPPGEYECTLDEMEARFASEQHSSARQEIVRAFRSYLLQRPLRNAVDHVIVDGSFVSEKPNPRDIDVIVGLKPALIRPLLHNQAGLAPDAVLKILQGERSRRNGRQLVHAFPFPVGSPQYSNVKRYFQTSTRSTEPAAKGVLRVTVAS